MNIRMNKWVEQMTNVFPFTAYIRQSTESRCPLQGLSEQWLQKAQKTPGYTVRGEAGGHSWLQTQSRYWERQTFLGQSARAGLPWLHRLHCKNFWELGHSIIITTILHFSYVNWQSNYIFKSGNKYTKLLMVYFPRVNNCLPSSGCIHPRHL